MYLVDFALTIISGPLLQDRVRLTYINFLSMMFKSAALIVKLKMRVH